MALINRIITSPNDHPSLPSVSIYFQGCDAQPKCPHCHNPETWEFDERFFFKCPEVFEITKNKLKKLLETFDQVAVCFLGGEPLSPTNRNCTMLLAFLLKKEFNDRIVNTLFTWRSFEQVKEILGKDLQFFDELVTEPFDFNLKTHKFPASLNQKYFVRSNNEWILKEGLF